MLRPPLVRVLPGVRARPKLFVVTARARRLGVAPLRDFRARVRTATPAGDSSKSSS
jgi:hypothetical protein